MVASVDVLLDEADIIRLILDYLSGHGFLVSVLTLERESGITSGNYSDEGHFVRRLILDGQWNDVLSFLQPLSGLPKFDMKALQYIIEKQRYLEMLSFKSELQSENHKPLLDDLVKCLAALEEFGQSKIDHDNLCALLTLSNLREHIDYKNWNLQTARLECFEKVYAIIVKFLPVKKSSESLPKKVCANRLIDLFVKGLLYESCSEYCLEHVISINATEDFRIPPLLTASPLSDSDLCLASWLTVLPTEVFFYSFERSSLNVGVKSITHSELPSSNSQKHVDSEMTLKSSLRSSNSRPSSLCLDSRRRAEKSDLERGTLDKTSNQISLNSVDCIFNAAEHVNMRKLGQSLDTTPVSKLSNVNRVSPRMCDVSNCIDNRIAEELGKDFDNSEISRVQTAVVHSNHKEFQRSYSVPCNTLCLKGIRDKNYVPKFIELIQIEDPQIIRAASFHPDGLVFAVGSNSKVLRVCRYPSEDEIKKLIENTMEPKSADILYTSGRHHRGSIYCISWNPSGTLIATGSNDKNIRVTRFCRETLKLLGKDFELTCHDGTVRDLVFVDDGRLVSGGAGDCKIYLTDCETEKTIRALSYHAGHVYSLYGWGREMIISGSQDGTACLWDLRSLPSPVRVIPSPSQGSAFAAVAVDLYGRLLASGHEDSTCVLWDIRNSGVLKHFQPHSGEVRSVRFSPGGDQLLTGSYDQTIRLTDLSGDLSEISSVVVARHRDKVIQCRWHPNEDTFVSTSVDRSVGCWISADQHL